MLTKEWEKEFIIATIIGAPNCDIRTDKIKWDYILNGDTVEPKRRTDKNMHEWIVRH